MIVSEVLCNAKMTHQLCLARRVTRALQSNTDAGDLGQGQQGMWVSQGTMPLLASDNGSQTQFCRGVGGN